MTASSGNTATAAAAYCAAAGLHCVILLEPGNPPAKLRQALATGATVVPVEGVFAHGPEGTQDIILRVAERLRYYPAFVWAPVNPYILEGIKTISYEIAARLPGAPDVVVCPVGGGDMLTAQWRGWLELRRAGVVDRVPRMIGVQSLSAPPLLEAFRAGTPRVAPLPYARSRISGINVPFTGEHALAAVRESGGVVVGIDDADAFAMQARLGAEEGVWVEPASAAPVAALSQLLRDGHVGADETVVCLLSGAGFKDALLAADEAESVARSRTRCRSTSTRWWRRSAGRRPRSLRILSASGSARDAVPSATAPARRRDVAFRRSCVSSPIPRGTFFVVIVS